MTYSTLTPLVSIQFDRSFDYAFPFEHKKGIGRFVPSADGRFLYSSARGPRLAVAPEEGRTAEIGMRIYRDVDAPTAKFLAADTEYGTIFHHVSVQGTAAVSVASSESDYLDSNVLVRSKKPGVFDSAAKITGQTLDELSVRGYPNQLFVTRQSVFAGMESRFPIWRIFRGWGTRPLFLKNLYGFGFAEAAYLGDFWNELLPGVGGGLHLSTDWFYYLPITFSAEYHRGLQEKFGGQGEFFFVVYGLSVSL
jgi:hypothetical protein